VSLDDAFALAALLALVASVVLGTVKGMRHAVAVERRYSHQVRDAQRQTRRCPYCFAWFNTTALQDAHEKDCDQQPAESAAHVLPPVDWCIP